MKWLVGQEQICPLPPPEEREVGFVAVVSEDIPEICVRNCAPSKNIIRVLAGG
jgi:hypothetical protein